MSHNFGSWWGYSAGEVFVISLVHLGNLRYCRDLNVLPPTFANIPLRSRSVDPIQAKMAGLAGRQKKKKDSELHEAVIP